jgi:hypothetical protein
MSPTRSSIMPTIFALARILSPASLKCESSFCFGPRAVKFQKRMASNGTLTVAQRISARPSTASQTRFQTISGLSWTHELFQSLHRLSKRMVCLEDGSRASFVIERLRIAAIHAALGLAAPLSQKLRILERTGFIVSDPNATVTHRRCREALRPNVPSLTSWPTRPCDLMGLSIFKLVPFGRVSLASVRV